MVTWRKKRMLKKPRSAIPGRQNQRCICQLVFGRFSGVQRRPISITPTRYPFSVRRRAETLPPKPEPMTMKSKSNLSGSNDMWDSNHASVRHSGANSLLCLRAAPLCRYRGRQHLFRARHTATGVTDLPVRTDEVNGAVHQPTIRVVESCDLLFVFVYRV